MYSQNFFRRFPVTSIVLLLCIAVYGGIRFGLFPAEYFVFVPGPLSVSNFLWSVTHIDFTHLVFNMIAGLQMGTLLEHNLGARRVWMVTLCIWLLVSLSAFLWIEYPLVGFSGVLMGWVTYGMLALWKQPQLRQALAVWLGLNIVVGFLPGISFLGHLLGAVAGLIVFVGFHFVRSLSKSI